MCPAEAEGNQGSCAKQDGERDTEEIQITNDFIIHERGEGKTGPFPLSGLLHK